MQRPSQAGFTLIEVMVTVFVVAIGLLTAAALQAVSKRATFDAAQRTIATALAQEMVERMRANANPLVLPTYDTTPGNGNNSGDVTASSPPSDPGCGDVPTNVCTPSQQVRYDLFQWWKALDGAGEQITGGSNAGGLSSVTGCIRQSQKVTQQMEITIAWRGLTPMYQGYLDPNASAGDPTASTCGQGNTDYDDPSPSASSKANYRRVLVLTANFQ